MEDRRYRRRQRRRGLVDPEHADRLLEKLIGGKWVGVLIKDALDPVRAARPRHRIETGAGRTRTDPRRWVKDVRRLRFCRRLFEQASGVCGFGGVTNPSTVIPGRRKASNPESRDSPMCNRTSEVCAKRRIR